MSVLSPNRRQPCPRAKHSFTPLIGFHFILAAFIALVLRGSLLASAAGTMVGNPLTFPLIWMATFKVGNVLTGRDGHAAGLNAEDLPAAAGDVSGRLWEMYEERGLPFVGCALTLASATHRVMAEQ